MSSTVSATKTIVTHKMKLIIVLQRCTTVIPLFVCLRYESKGKQFAKHQPQYPVGLSPEIVNAARVKKEKADKAASKSNPIPGLVIVSTPEGIFVFVYCFTLCKSPVALCYF
jgi:hypothetical protein